MASMTQLTQSRTLTTATMTPLTPSLLPTTELTLLTWPPPLSRYLSTPLKMFQINKSVTTMMPWQTQNPTPRHSEPTSTFTIPDINSPVTGGTVPVMPSMTITRDTQAKVSLLTRLIRSPRVIPNSHRMGSSAEIEKNCKDCLL